MAHGERGVDEGLLLCGVGIELSADGLEAVDDVPAAAAGCAFEEHVFDEVGHALFVGQFIACAGVDRHATVGDRHLLGDVQEAQAVGKCVCVVFHNR